jgi:hypothetical protein
MGRHRIKGRPGLKTGKKYNRGAPCLLILHNSGCRRIKVKLLDSALVKNARNCMDSVQRGEGRGGLKIRQNVRIDKKSANF